MLAAAPERGVLEYQVLAGTHPSPPPFLPAVMWRDYEDVSEDDTGTGGQMKKRER